MMIARKYCLLPLLLLLAACASPPEMRDVAPPFPLPSAWTAGGAGGEMGVNNAWWKEFNDAVLDRLVAEALARHPSLAAAEARVRQSLALAEMAGADLVPHVSAGAQGGKSRQYMGQIPMLSSTITSRSYGASLNLSWEVDLWGRIRAGQAAALADVQGRKALLHGAALSLAAQTTKAYFAATEAGIQLEIARATHDSAASLARRIRDRFNRGLRNALDVKLAENEVAGTLAQVAATRRLRDGAVRQLEVLAGRYPSAGLIPATVLPGLPGPPPAGVPADLLGRRPDMAGAERRLAAAEARTREASASLYPRISLTGSTGLASDDVGDILKGDYSVWSLAANLAAPLFEGGRLRANVKLQEARHDEARAGFAQNALVAFQEVESALAAEHLAGEQVSALKKAVEEAGAGLRLSEERYLAGLADILSVLEARRRHFSARSLLLDAQRKRLGYRVDTYVALGGGFSRDRIEGNKENP